ncbi:TonB-dependent receptor [Croceibacterium ferulae]|uniref:TonB-dependent receptor n=1 Tax=Croceibacterium ferulae TaxID=1854641 RepID=UPI000EB0BBB5|nr:TonB-dependent receptor [Croceibacterium ferulae]
MNHANRFASAAVSLLAIAAASLCAAPAAAQDQVVPGRAADEQAAPANPPEGNEILVTGFRASLESALELKRNETAAIDSIVAEDIGKFPDSNLAESMQRIPGVALARGDGGEGRNISVRGLGAQFTRVRINGMEGTSQTGGSDIFGAGNTGRSFDFNTFPTEIFSRLTVRKTPSADVEEGSLGATVDLSAPKPFDNAKDFVFSATARGVYNEVADQVDPRASLLVSQKFGDFGVLFSAAYQRRNLREVGYAAVDLLPANVNGGFCSPIGFTPQNPANNPAKGVTPTACSTDNPRTGIIDAYQTILDLRRADAPDTPGSGAFFPRIPRYVNSEQDQQRIAGTLTLQWQPSADTDVSLDLLLSEFDVERRDNYIAGLSFARSISNNGQPMVSVRDVEFDENGSLVYGLFDGVDVRSEGLVDKFTTTFQQANLNIRQRLGDTLELTGLFGISESRLDGPSRLQTFIDVIDTDNFSIDFRDDSVIPTIGFGFDVSNPANFTYAPGRSDGTVLGGFSLQGRPLRNTIDNKTAELNLNWEASDAVSFKVGGQYRESEFRGRFYSPYTADIAVRPLPAGVSVADITRQIEGVGELWGYGAPDSWAAVDPDRFSEVFGVEDVRLCGVECGAGDTRIRERIVSGYAMATFDATDLVGIGLRGDIGVRYVHTDQRSSGYIAIGAPAGTSPTNVFGQLSVAERSYDDWLPSANLVFEPADGLLFRLSAAKVMSRPELQQLAPTSGVNPITRVGNVNNPFLEPIRANTFDAAVEWYWAPGALLSAAFFYKDIGSFIQTINSQIPFSELGLPNALLDGSGTAPTELFNVSRPTNTDGGPLKGLEVNAQVPFSAFATGFLESVGVLANYTHVTSEIEYCLASQAGACINSTTNDLVGLSRNTASGTLYYDDGKFSIRSTANWRDRFVRGIPASQGSDLQGNSPTLFVDASASYAINDHVGLILEAQNLTDEQNRLYIDSVREDTLFQLRFGRTFTAGVNVQF